MIRDLVTCMCSTCGRPQLLEEAIDCFLRQDYLLKELIILNDHPHQTLVHHCLPGVHVINWPQRLPSLGAKREMLKNLAQGEYLTLWDDDDLHAPWALSTAVDFLMNNPDVDVYSPCTALVLNDNVCQGSQGNYYEAGATIRRSYARKHTYPQEMNIRMDLEFMKDAVVHRPDEDGYWTYVYRWGMGVHHLSGFAQGDVPENWQAAWKHIENLAHVPHEWELHPRNNEDAWNSIVYWLQTSEDNRNESGEQYVNDLIDARVID